MDAMKIEIQSYTSNNTGFAKFAFENSTILQQEFAKEKFYIYNYAENVERIDYNDLERRTGISYGSLRKIVHELKCRKNGIK